MAHEGVLSKRESMLRSVARLSSDKRVTLDLGSGSQPRSLYIDSGIPPYIYFLRPEFPVAGHGPLSCSLSRYASVSCWFWIWRDSLETGMWEISPGQHPATALAPLGRKTPYAPMCASASCGTSRLIESSKPTLKGPSSSKVPRNASLTVFRGEKQERSKTSLGKANSYRLSEVARREENRVRS